MIHSFVCKFTGLAFRSNRNEDVQRINFEPGKNYYRSKANEGNFIGLVKLLADENEILAKHIENCQQLARSGHRSPITFLSKSFINGALFAIREYLVMTIVNEINRNGGRFGLLMDGSQDVSSKEQISVVVRYINDASDVVERSISFFNAKDTSGEALYNALRSTLSDIGLSLSNTVGCSFDGAANMRGEFCGLKSYIIENNVNCMYVWCLSHQFNLANNFAIAASEPIQRILKIAEDSAKIFRGSYVKMNIWSEIAKSVPGYNPLQRLKLIGTTRWSSKPNAIATIIDDETHLFVLIKAMIKVCSLKNLERKKLEDACEILNSWLNYENIMTTYVLQKIFTVTNQTTLFLQTAGLSFVNGIESLTKCNKMLEDVKNQLSNYLKEANNFVEKTNDLLSCDEEVQSLECECVIRLPIEEEHQEMIANLQLEFGRFIETLKDRINNNILLEFDREHSLYDEMHTLDPIYAKACFMSSNGSIRIKKLCDINNVDQKIVMNELKELIFDFFNDKINKLVEGSDENSDSDEAAANIRSQNVKHDVDVVRKSCHCSLCILKYIGAAGDHDREIKFANISRLYKYIAIIPCTQVKCERDFSKMKLIKTRLRANLTDESMENLMLISSEANMFEHIDLHDIVNHIIEKSPKVSLYLNT